MTERARDEEIRRAANDWLVRIQLGDTTGPGETAGQRMEALAAFETWRKADPAHAATYDALLKSLRQGNILRGGDVVAHSQLRRAGFPRRHPWLSGAVAAGLIAVAGMSAYRVVLPRMVGHGISGASSSMADLDAIKATPVGQTRSIGLPDGSSVLLDADSQFRVLYTAGERRLRLDHGRARFTVAHDASRPFIVEAGDSTVIAHGTIFDVSVGAAGVHVALLRGEIEVRRGTQAPGADPEQMRQLKPGEAVRLAPAAAMPMPEPVSSSAFDWVSGRLAFADTPLDEAVEEINRYNVRKVVLDASIDRNLRISGGFDARAPQAFAASVAQVLHLRVQTVADGNLLLLPETGRGHR